MGRAELKLKGIRNMGNNLEKLLKVTAPNVYRSAVIKAMLMVEAESARRVPVDTGNLRYSGLGNARITESSPVGAKGEVGYTAKYAVYVHERTDLRHQPGKEAKFLQKAVAHEATRMANDMKVSISKTMFQKGKK